MVNDRGLVASILNEYSTNVTSSIGSEDPLTSERPMYDQLSLYFNDILSKHLCAFRNDYSCQQIY